LKPGNQIKINHLNGIFQIFWLKFCPSSVCTSFDIDYFMMAPREAFLDE